VGRASDEIICLYERTASAWMEARGAQAAERSWMDRLTAGRVPNAAILDIGCGHGLPLAAELVRRGFRVTGVDAAPSLIAAARANVPGAEFQVADMRRLALGRRFDALLAWHSFFHLAADDQRAMFPIFAAHAAPGARLMFTSGAEAGEAIGEWQGEPLHHASLSPDEYRDLLGANGFEVESFSGPGQEATVWTALYMRPASGLDGSA